LRRDPPVVEQKKPVSWADVLGPEAGAGVATEAPAAAASATAVDPNVKAAAGAKLEAPLSWMDVIGAAPAALYDPPSAPVEAPPASPVAPPAQTPITQTTPPPAPPAPAEAQDGKAKIPMSWADVIGAGLTDDDKE
jgi:hypothetical protein